VRLSATASWGGSAGETLDVALPMNLAAALFKSSIGRKIIMAVTGLVLLGFVTGHLIGNFHVLGAPEEINGYAHFLQGLGPVLWLVRLFLLVCVGLHIWAAVVLTLENKKARPQEYEHKKWIQASVASRWMAVSGLLVLAFIVYHLLHFTVGVDSDAFVGDAFKARHEYVMQHDFHLLGLLLVTKGTVVHDVHHMMVQGFLNSAVSVAYIIATALLSFHLWHGIESMFQTLGLKTSRWSAALKFLARAYCLAYFAGNALIVGLILSGTVKPHPPQTAHVGPASTHP
jgi:succinate dehydrogenase / fumarate reductase cytochrome b subunit